MYLVLLKDSIFPVQYELTLTFAIGKPITGNMSFSHSSTY